MAYSDKVIEHYEKPRNVGSMDKGDPNVGTGLVGAPACGDVMKLQLKISDEGIIEDAKFKTFGCGSAIASSSLVTEWVKGKSLEDANRIRNSDIAEELSLPPVKIHCSVLAEDAVKAAIYDFKLKKGLLSVAEVYEHDLALARANRAEGESDEAVEARVRAGVADYARRTGQELEAAGAAS
jgi:nitrogen fixation protein NifU and related proteins